MHAEIDEIPTQYAARGGTTDRDKRALHSEAFVIWMTVEIGRKPHPGCALLPVSHSSPSFKWSYVQNGNRNC